MPAMTRATPTVHKPATSPWPTGAPGAMTTGEAKKIGDTPFQRALRAERESDKERSA